MNTFLNTYKPANERFTSFEEMALIEEKLNLKSVDLFETRNKVVQFYSDKMQFEREHGLDYWDTMTAMQSVTAVIDHFKIQKGMPV